MPDPHIRRAITVRERGRVRESRNGYTRALTTLRVARGEYRGAVGPTGGRIRLHHPDQPRCNDDATQADARPRGDTRVPGDRNLPARTGRGRARGPDDVGRAHHAGSDMVRSRRDARDHHAVFGDVRDARRDGEAHARQSDGAEPGGVVDRVPGRARLRVRHPPEREVPHGRPGDSGGRQVLLRALSRDVPSDPQGQGGGRRDSRCRRTCAFA